MKKIKTKNFPPGNFIAINIFGILFYKGDKLNEITIRHEEIHTQQIIEIMLSSIPIAILIAIFIKIWVAIIFCIFSFYIVYSLEWCIKFFKYGFNTYRNLSFEREAYINAREEDYIKNRKLFSWVKYFKSK